MENKNLYESRWTDKAELKTAHLNTLKTIDLTKTTVQDYPMEAADTVTEEK